MDLYFFYKLLQLYTKYLENKKNFQLFHTLKKKKKKLELNTER